MLTFTLTGLSLPFVSDFLGRAKGILLQCSGVFIIAYGLKMSGLALVRMNVELPENQAIAEQFKVRAVPTISLISVDGKEIAHSVGYQSESKLRQGINMFPKMACDSAKANSLPKDSPVIPEGKSCESEGNGLTC